MVRMPRTTRALIMAVLASLLVLSSVAVASADNVIGDGDGVVPVSTSKLDFGSTVCLGSTTTKDVALGVERQTGASQKTFRAGALVTFTVNSNAGTGLTAAMG